MHFWHFPSETEAGEEGGIAHLGFVFAVHGCELQTLPVSPANASSKIIGLTFPI